MRADRTVRSETCPRIGQVLYGPIRASKTVGRWPALVAGPARREIGRSIAPFLYGPIVGPGKRERVMGRIVRSEIVSGSARLVCDPICGSGKRWQAWTR